MIKINDRFSIERDQYNWLLHEWRDGQDKDGNPKKQKSTTYHATIQQVFNAVLDRSAGRCESIEELRDLLKSLKESGWAFDAVFYNG